MKLAVVCANGKAGTRIVEEAVNRGLDVTAVVRGENRTAATKTLNKDLFQLTAADLAGFDVVIDAFGAWTEDTLPQHSTSLKHLCDILSGTTTRLLVVGGAGSLYVNQEHTACVADGPDFPDGFKPLAAAMAKALGELRQRDDVLWTYLSPAGISGRTAPAPAATAWEAKSWSSTTRGRASSAMPTMPLPWWTRPSRAGLSASGSAWWANKREHRLPQRPRPAGAGCGVRIKKSIK